MTTSSKIRVSLSVSPLAIHSALPVLHALSCPCNDTYGERRRPANAMAIQSIEKTPRTWSSPCRTTPCLPGALSQTSIALPSTGLNSSFSPTSSASAPCPSLCSPASPPAACWRCNLRPLCSVRRHSHHRPVCQPDHDSRAGPGAHRSDGQRSQCQLHGQRTRLDGGDEQIDAMRPGR